MRVRDAAFCDELLKVGSVDFDPEDIRDVYRDVKKKVGSKPAKPKSLKTEVREKGPGYAASAGIGAIASPIAALLTAKVKRGLHNRDVKRIMKMTKDPVGKRALEGSVMKGSTFARSNVGRTPQARALMTPKDLVVDALRGAGLGVGAQYIKGRMGEG